MRSILATLLFSLLSFTVFPTDYNTVGWKTYLSYTNTNAVEESASEVYVVAENYLYTYGKEDNSIKQYSKGNGLNNSIISLIRYNNQTKSLIIVYENSDIDILQNGVSKNIPYLFTSTSIQDKSVNSILIDDKLAYLSTTFGIVVIDMDKKEVKETYNLSLNISSCATHNGYIYASVTGENRSSEIIRASLNLNLQDKTNWGLYTLPDFPKDNLISTIISFKNTVFYFIKNQGVYYEKEGTMVPFVRNGTMSSVKIIGDKLACINSSQIYIFSDLKTFDQINNLTIKDISTYQPDKFWIAEGSKGLRSLKKTGANKFEAVNESIRLDGPYTNSTYKILCKNKKVYIIPGGKNNMTGKRFNQSGSVSIYDYNKWIHLDPTEIYSSLNIRPRDYTNIAVTSSEKGEEIIYASSMGDGIIQYQDGKPIHSFNEKNSPIQNAGGLSSNYCFMDGLTFDKDGNLWMTNSEVNNAVLVLDRNNQWHSLDIEALKGQYTISDILITSHGDKWINVPRVNPKLVVIAASNSLDQISTNEFNSFTDSDGKDFSPNNYTCMAEDKNGSVWVGTNRGPIYFTNPSIASSNAPGSIRCTRVKIENKQTNALQYFLDNTTVSTLKIDAANRKWIGTQGNGVYVLDNENQEIVHQFNTTNSPLLSDNIYCIEINDETGEVFIGTDKGLMSYQGDVTEPSPDYSDIYAFPNPVRPDQMDKVTITNLIDNSTVKITDVNGNLIYQTKSLGGQAVWNCRNSSGERVATGIYLVLATTENSSESVVTKILIIK